MTDTSWIRAGAAEWLVAPRPRRPGPAGAVGAVSFGVGLLHEPIDQLGVATLLGAWLTSQLARPVEAVDATSQRNRAEVTVSLSPLDFSVIAVGTASAVAATLRRVELLLAAVAEAEVDDDLQGRARVLYRNPLAPWRAHLAARWPGHAPHLAALGPLALPSLDAAALASFVAERVRPASRVYWTDEPAVPELVGNVGYAPADSATAWEAVAPTGRRDAPGCVLLRGEVELLSVTAPSGPSSTLALVVLQRTLQRRLVELEPLASGVALLPIPLGGDVLLVGAEAELVPDRAPAARAAAIQTLEDLAAGGVSSSEIESVRQAYVARASEVDSHQPGTVLELVRSQLQRGDRPTPHRRAAELAQVSNEQVRAALAELYPQLLLATPMGEEAPLPMAEPVELPKPEGRRYFHWMYGARWVQSSPRRLGIVARDGRHRRTTIASVDFDEVVLRLDVDDQATILVDRYLRTATVEWDVYRRGRRLREHVDRATAGAPLIQQPPDPEWIGPTARQLRWHRRRFAIGIAGYVIGGLGVLGVVLGIIFDRPEGPDEPAAVETVDAAATVTLRSGATLEIAGGPELIYYYVPERPYTYAVQVRMCGGEDSSASTFGSTSFFLDVSGQRPRSFSGIPERPALPGEQLQRGECATGWLLYHLAGATLERAPTLHFISGAGDRAAWQLDPHPPRSDLSRPPA